MSIRILIADDQQLVRTGFRAILSAEPDLEVVGEAGDGHEAIDASARLSPDIVLMDIRMPKLDGLAATRRLTAGASKTRVIILTTFDLDEYVYEALRGGASGFLLKDAPAEQLVTAIRVVADGEALLAPSITRRLIAEFARHPPPDAKPAQIEALTTRELQVLKLVARGLSNGDIGMELFLSDATIKTHVRHILAKLGLHDRVQVVVLAYESGVVRPGERSAASG